MSSREPKIHIPSASSKSRQPMYGNPHDRFGRKTIGDPKIAGNLLAHYTEPAIAETVHLDRLEEAKTNFFGQEFKELISDVSFLARLKDEASGTEMLFTLEHKSRPAPFVPIQLGAYALIAQFSDFAQAGYAESKESFKPRVPIMVLIYCGDKDIDEEIFYQDIFGKVLKKLEKIKEYVPQFKVLVINLRRFKYGQLPGDPETQAVVEAMKRAFDGTFVDKLDSVLGHLGGLPLNERIRKLVEDIIRYSAWVGGTTAEQIDRAIRSTWKGQEGTKMAQTIQKGLLQQGIEQGIELGEAKALTEKAETVLVVLRARFKKVPKAIEKTVRKAKDKVVLDSWAAHAATCKTLEEFEKAIH